MMKKLLLTFWVLLSLSSILSFSIGAKTNFAKVAGAYVDDEPDEIEGAIEQNEGDTTTFGIE